MRHLGQPVILATFLGLVALAIGPSSAPASNREDDLAQLYTEARKAQLAGDYETARRKYERIVSLRPDLGEAHANLGLICYLQGRIDQAVSSFKEAIRLKPELSIPHLFLGVISFKARQYEDALKHLSKAEALSPSDGHTQLYLGYTYYAQSKFLEAVRHLEKVVDMGPADIESFLDALYHLSKSYGHLSWQHFDLLQRRFPNSLHIHLARAHFYEAEQNWEKAKDEYSRALEKMPDNERLQQRLKWVEDKASVESTHKFEISPADELIDGSTRFLYNPPTGEKLKEELQRHQEMVKGLRYQSDASAEKIYLLAESYQILSYLASQWILDIDPDSYRAHQLKGQYYEAIDKDEEAIREYRRALELKPKLENIHFSIGNIYWKRGRFKEALAELQKEIEINPHHAQALYEIGDIFALEGKLEKAQECFIKALGLDPSMKDAHLAVGRIYATKGEHDKALSHLRKAAEIDPGDPSPHYAMSAVYRKLGMMEEAEREMEIYKKLKAQEGSRSRDR